MLSSSTPLVNTGKSVPFSAAAVSSISLRKSGSPPASMMILVPISGGFIDQSAKSFRSEFDACISLLGPVIAPLHCRLHWLVTLQIKTGGAGRPLSVLFCRISAA